MIAFFFKAEDGIRDTSVTGVQTCALPIWGVLDRHAHAARVVRQGRVRRARARLHDLEPGLPAPALLEAVHIRGRGARVVAPPPGAPGDRHRVPRSEERRVGKARTARMMTTM